MTPHEIAGVARSHDAAQWDDELEEMIELVHEREPRVVLEIGTLLGGTLAAWCLCATPDALIISVDLENGPWCGPRVAPEGHEKTLQTLQQPGQNLHLLRADSQKPATLKAVKELLGRRKVDLLFIDGNHELEPCLHDYRTFSPLVAKGGLIALHDIRPINGHPDARVWVVWDLIKEQEPERIEFTGGYPQHSGGRDWGGIGVIVK